MKLGVVITTPEARGAPPVALLSGPFEAKLERAAQLGYAGVELMTQRPGELDPAQIAGQVSRCGLEIAAIASGAITFLDRLTLLHPDASRGREAEKRLHELIDFAAAVAAPLVTIGGFRGRLANAAWADAKGARLHLVEILRRAAHHAAKQGVCLALEPMNRYESDIATNAEEGLALIADLSPRPPLLPQQERGSGGEVGLLLDTFHMNLEEADYAATIGRVAAAGRLFHVHLGDSNRLAPGQGHIDFAEIVAALRRVDYQGYLSAELLAGADPDAAAAATIHHMRRLL